MRYLPLTEADRSAMLKRIGVSSVDALYEDVPARAARMGALGAPTPSTCGTSSR